MTRRIVLQVMLALALAAPAAAWWISTPAEDTGPASTPVPVPAVVVSDALTGRVASPFAGLPEEATMVLVGTALLGAAAAVRRAA